MSNRRSPISQLLGGAVVLATAFSTFAGPSGLPPAAGRGRPLPPELVVGPAQAAPDAQSSAATLPPEDRAKGVVWAGLERAKPDGPCRSGFEGSAANRVFCTHGPDAAPPGIDVRAQRSVEDMAAGTAAGGSIAAETAGVPCYGDGTSGNRVQAIYARASDVSDRYASLVSMFPQWAANADRAYADSAAETGGVRHIRWATDAGCNLSVARVQLSTNGDNSFNAMMSELWNLGFNRTDRKYLVWVDANVYCGVGDIDWDDRAIATNYNNVGPSFARVDQGCWGLSNSVEAHETMHNLGGVQNSAPHTTNGHHCTDESDRMCYADGSAGVVMTYPCPSTHERLFDCNHDDYFHTAPAPTSYLGTHWNSAMSSFLESTNPVSTTPTTSPSTTTTVPSSTTTTVPPSGPTTDIFHGALKKSSSKTYSVLTGAGTMDNQLSFSGSASEMTVTVKAANGVVVGQKKGPSVVTLPVTAQAGTYTIVVSQTANGTTSFSLRVAHPTP